MRVPTCLNLGEKFSDEDFDSMKQAIADKADYYIFTLVSGTEEYEFSRARKLLLKAVRDGN